MIDLYYMWKKIEEIVLSYTNTIKIVVSGCFLLATIIMISPNIAATSPVPWLLFLFGNILWMLDAYVHKQFTWFWASVVFSIYDTLIVYSRITNIDTIEWVKPFVYKMEQILL